jgi:hypothetical protein
MTHVTVGRGDGSDALPLTLLDVLEGKVRGVVRHAWYDAHLPV